MVSSNIGNISENLSGCDANSSSVKTANNFEPSAGTICIIAGDNKEQGGLNLRSTGHNHLGIAVCNRRMI